MTPRAIPPPPLPVSQAPVDNTSTLVRQFIEMNRQERDEERTARKDQLGAMWAMHADVRALRTDFGTMSERMHASEARLIVLCNDVGSLAKRTDRLEGKQDDLAETTGRFEVSALQLELNERKERARHWTRWAIAAVVALATGAAGTAIASVLHGCV